jgi:hypothetical protein
MVIDSNLIQEQTLIMNVRETVMLSSLLSRNPVGRRTTG